ncbi:hypothetical protein Tco_1388095, partial [Tanacetum coccineum]
LEEHMIIVGNERDENETRWVCDSSLDHKGGLPLRSSTGTWKAAFFIIVMVSLVVIVMLVAIVVVVVVGNVLVENHIVQSWEMVCVDELELVDFGVAVDGELDCRTKKEGIIHCS